MADYSGLNELLSTRFLGSNIARPTLAVDANLSIPLAGIEDQVAHVMKLEIELIEEVRSQSGSTQAFTLRLSVDNGDGTVGLHQRSLSGFEPDKYNAIWLVAHALAQFSDVTGKEGV